MLTNPNGLGMIEAVGSYTGKKIGPTYFGGQLPINGIWVTPDVMVANTCIMPAGYGIGDHRLFIVDLHTSLLVRPGPPSEQRAVLQWLNTRLPHDVKKYIHNLKQNLTWHQLIKKLRDAHTGGTSREDVQSKIIKVDGDGMQYMKHLTKKCRRLKSRRNCFSPELVIRIKREQIYNLLAEYHLGRNKNRWNLKSVARRKGFKKPF
jgi:hypothetical protein